MATNFDYDIVTLEAKPTSDYRYAARVGQITRSSNGNPEIVPWNDT